MTLAPRFWNKVQKSTECWIWTAATTREGYGRYWTDGRLASAHRLAYESEHGPIPPHLELDHLCRTPACVNPAHLEPVTRSENAKRGNHSGNKTICKNGHDLADAYVYPTGRRKCRQCRTARMRAARQAQRLILTEVAPNV